jgi:hypothetical protein
VSSARVEVVLKWLEAVLREHHRTAYPRKPLVLPATLGERHRWMPLVEEVFKASDGVVVDATGTRGESECGDIETDAPGLVAHVRAFLDGYNVLDSTANLSLDIADGRVVVDGDDFGAVNAAQKAVREVAAAMCDFRLRDAGLAALVYAEESLSSEVLALVWGAVTGMLETLPLHVAPETLCVVAGDSTASPGVNCSGANSLRFRVDEELSERHAYETELTVVGELGRHTAEDLPVVVLFLGAGASVADGLPTGDRLRDRALTSLKRKEVDGTTFRDVVREWYAELESRSMLLDFETGPGAQDQFIETLTLERVLEHEQLIEGRNFSTTLRAFANDHDARFDQLEAMRIAGELADDPIARLCKRRARFVIVTVNFDRFVEARAGDDVEVFAELSDLERFPAALKEYVQQGGRVPILKLHGTINNPVTLETNSGLNEQRQAAIQALLDLVAEAPLKQWWYVGYSMRDQDLLNIWSKPEMSQMNEHWVDPYLNPNVEKFIGKHRIQNWRKESFSITWTAANRHVSLTASDFLAELADVVDRDWT